MLAHVAAELIVLLHFAFIVFVLFGAGLTLRWKWIVWLHMPAFLWGAAIEFLGAICPLTPLEQRLRVAAGEAGYTGGFVEHYIVPVIYPAGLNAAIQLWLGVGVVVLNAAIYAWVLFARRSPG
jgi:hypothetical protein